MRKPLKEKKKKEKQSAAGFRRQLVRQQQQLFIYLFSHLARQDKHHVVSVPALFGWRKTTSRAASARDLRHVLHFISL